jgi:AAA-like domain
VTNASNFYVAGGTLRRDAESYVHRKADEELYQEILRGEFCYILTARQMGKSSLMVRTSARLRDAKIAVAVLDLTAIGQNLSPEQWYGGLLMQLGSRFDLQDELMEFWERQSLLGPMQRWIRAIRNVVLAQRHPERIVIFIDEIDSVRSLPFSADEFFAGIRECYNHRTQYREMERLTFCLLGVAAPTDLVRDVRLTPFNIGRRIELHDFTAEEAAPLASAGTRHQEPHCSSVFCIGPGGILISHNGCVWKSFRKKMSAKRAVWTACAPTCSSRIVLKSETTICSLCANVCCAPRPIQRIC